MKLFLFLMISVSALSVQAIDVDSFYVKSRLDKISAFENEILTQNQWYENQMKGCFFTDANCVLQSLSMVIKNTDDILRLRLENRQSEEITRIRKEYSRAQFHLRTRRTTCDSKLLNLIEIRSSQCLISVMKSYHNEQSRLFIQLMQYEESLY